MLERTPWTRSSNVWTDTIPPKKAGVPRGAVCGRCVEKDYGFHDQEKFSESIRWWSILHPLQGSRSDIEEALEVQYLQQWMHLEISTYCQADDVAADEEGKVKDDSKMIPTISQRGSSESRFRRRGPAQASSKVKSPVGYLLQIHSG